MPRTTSPIDVVEAAYDLERDDRSWLLDLAKLVRPLVDGGRGVSAYAFDVTRPGPPLENEALLLDMTRADWNAMLRLTYASARLSTLAKAMHVHPEAFGSLTDQFRRAKLGDMRRDPELAEFFHNIGDAVALRTIEPGGKGVLFCGLQAHARHVDRRTAWLWSRVAAHIAAARRLRSAAGKDDAVEAVLTPAGRLDDARGEGTTRTARDVLRAAVLRQEKARGRQRRTDPARATEAWTALVNGRWSLVDRFERGGRRFIVARRNLHALPDPRALTERERAVAHLAALGKSNKLIAYELGLADSTVATHVAAVMRKLGATSRIDVLRLITGFNPA